MLWKIWLGRSGELAGSQSFPVADTLALVFSSYASTRDPKQKLSSHLNGGM